MINKKNKIFVAGHNGMVGSAICRKLESLGYKNLIKESSNKLDLRNSLETEHFFKSKNPEFVFLAAAKVGGILANSTYKADFIYDNIMIQNNVIHCAHKYKVEKLLFLIISRSELIISFTKEDRSYFGLQFKSSFALLASPIKWSTSVGRK